MRTKQDLLAGFCLDPVVEKVTKNTILCKMLEVLIDIRDVIAPGPVVIEDIPESLEPLLEDAITKEGYKMP